MAPGRKARVVWTNDGMAHERMDRGMIAHDTMALDEIWKGSSVGWEHDTHYTG